MAKVEKSMKIDQEDLQEIERLKQVSGEAVTFPTLARRAIKKEIAEMQKIYGKPGKEGKK